MCVGWWGLVEGLERRGVEFKEMGPLLLCRLGQRRDGLAYFEGVGVKVKKLQFRSVWGVKVTECLYQTRARTAPATATATRAKTVSATGAGAKEEGLDARAFAEFVKGILERAEEEEKAKEAKKGAVAAAASPMLGAESVFVGRCLEL